MKKHISLCFVLVMLFGAMQLSAQKPFAGSITYELSAENTDDVNVIAALAGKTKNITVMGNYTKTVADMQGIGVTTITNGDDNNSFLIITFPGYGGFYQEVTEADFKEQFETEKYDYNYTEETMEIAGYKCTKVIVKVTNLETDDENSLVVWVTNDLMLGDNINFASLPGLKGFPLRSETPVEQQGVSFTLVENAKEVKANKKIKSMDFLLPSGAVKFEDAPADVKAMLGAE